MVYIVLGALVIGLTLGLMGSGGSILTVPMLTYLLGHESKVAVAESLAIVGAIATVAVLPYARSKQVDWRSVLFFGVPGMAGTYVGAWIAGFISGALQLTLFAIVMLAAAATMFRKSKPARDDDTGPEQPSGRQSFWMIAAEGLVVGTMTGLVGVGGGFLIVPALAVLGGLPMRVAIGTSLAVIAMNSACGLYKYLDVLESMGQSIDWRTVGAFAVIGIVGSLTGKRIGSRIDQQALRRAFAVFLVVMGIFVLGKEVPAIFEQPAKPQAERAINFHSSVVMWSGFADNPTLTARKN